MQDGEKRNCEVKHVGNKVHPKDSPSVDILGESGEKSEVDGEELVAWGNDMADVKCGFSFWMGDDTGGEFLGLGGVSC
ncbi:hypothetical protein L1887_28795 [Cichorium endivia]|nr:hypothetical protein L1887_28795 [Cichorium endivia]